MKKSITFFVLGLLVVFSPQIGKAQISGYADLPVLYQFSDSAISGEKIGGFKIGATVPLFFLGFGYESYSVEGKFLGSSLSYDVMMFDLFLDIPFPILSLTLGGGLGQGNLTSGDETLSFTTAQVAQYFIDRKSVV